MATGLLRRSSPDDVACRVWGGSAHAESPECTPASSTCSMTPATKTSPVRSRSASTSTSMASSKKRSMSTGRCAVTPPSRSSDDDAPRPRRASTSGTA